MTNHTAANWFPGTEGTHYAGVALTADPRPFLDHQALATQWLRLRNRVVTDSAVARVMRDLSARDLRVVLVAYEATS